jgi:hypothetical protein
MACQECNTLQAKVAELELTLEKEQEIHLKIATRADRYFMQLEAIRQSAWGEICGVTADGPEDLRGIEEVE